MPMPAPSCARWHSPPPRSSLIALGAGLLLRMDRIALLGLVLNPFILSSVFVVNLIALSTGSSRSSTPIA